MTKESPYSNYPKLLFRETFRDEQTVRKNGGVPNNVSFENGEGSFDGSSSKINYSLGLNGTYSVRIKFKINDLSIYHYLFNCVGSNNDGLGWLRVQPSTGEIKPTSGVVYVNGVINNIINNSVDVDVVVAGFNLKQGTGNLLSVIGSDQANGYHFNGNIDLFEIYEGTLTAEEVANLYNNKWNNELPQKIERSYPQYSCDTTSTGWKRCADDNGSNNGGTYGAGKSLKAVGQGNGTNDVGFKGLLSGYRSSSGSFYNLGSILALWSSTSIGGSNAWRRYLFSSYSTINRNASSRGYGFGVRCVRNTNDTSDFTDPRDGTIYPCVKIGNQVWTTKNLAYLPSVNMVNDESETEPKYYVYNYNGTDVATAKATSKYQTYGVLYNYPAALEACPDGFHIPTDEEYNILEKETLKVIKQLHPNKTLLDLDSTNGVIEDRAVGSIVGDSVVVDGNPFVDGSWYKQTGWTITNGKAIANMTSGTGSIYQLNKITIGKKYKVIYKISNYVSGSGKALLGGGAGSGNLNSGNGTYVETLIATWDDIYFEAASGSEFSVDFLIITEVRDDLEITDVDVKKQGALFNGSTSKIDTGSDFIGTKPITILCWSKRYSRGEENEGRWLNNGKLIMRNTSGANNFYVFSGNGSTFATSKIDSLILNKFQFVAITRNIIGETNFYIGTKEEAPTIQNSSATDSGTPVAGSYNVIIGNNNGGSRTFDGLIPKLKVVEGILNLDKITQYWSETRKEIK